MPGKSSRNNCSIIRSDTRKTTPHKDRAIHLSHEVHRIGYHFPSYIVGRACISLGIDLSQTGHVLRRQQDWFVKASTKPPRQPRQPPKNRDKNKKKKLHKSGSVESPSSEVSQATLDTQAREAIKDLFPKIPDKDLHDIVSRAFRKVCASI